MRLGAVVVVALLVAGPAAAHIRMTFPTPRFDDGQNKWCPCGTGGDGTRANNGCGLSVSDPNRGATHNDFTAGQTITLAWTETVDHVGRFRVSFDPDGADQPDFDAHILKDIADPSGNSGAHTLSVTLPNVNCDNCTLQLIQVMNNDQVDPVATPINSYFQCANLVLTGATTGEGEGEGAAGEGEGAAGEGEGAAGEGEGAAGEGEGAAAGEGEGAAGEGEGEGTTTPPTTQGCPGCTSAGDAHALFAAGLAGLALVRRRRGKRA